MHVVFLALVLMVVSALALVAVLMFSLNQQASNAADFAALAASKASVEGESGCVAAERLAMENKVHLLSCRMDHDVATIKVKATVHTLFGDWGVKARARAAPDFYFE